MIADFHIHTKYSFDSIMSPKKIIKIAIKRGIDLIAITDHGTLKGGEITKKMSKNDIEVVVGEEIATDAGDIIGLNLNEEIKKGDWEEVVYQIRSQGGISVLPHPYRGHKHIWEIAKKVDFIEVWNGRTPIKQNDLALEMAKQLQKKMLAGSDAHLYTEIGNVKISVDRDWNMEKILVRGVSTNFQIIQSQVIGHLKNKNLYELLHKSYRKLIDKVLS